MLSAFPAKMRAPLLLALILFLVGCTGPTAVAQPTPDIPAERTQAVRTAVAKITIDAALNPSPTAPLPPEPLVITATPGPEQDSPTATELPASTELPAATATPASTELPGATATPAAATPLATPAPVLPTVAVFPFSPTATRRAGPDLAQYIEQHPFDGAVFNAGNEFDGTWTLKNIGTSTWSTAYEYRFASGTNLAKQNVYNLPRSVAPGETIKLITDMVAPPTAGRYVSHWELTNANGDVFAKFFLIIDVR